MTAVKPIAPTRISGTEFQYAQGMRAGNWLFFTGHEATDFQAGIVPQVAGKPGLPLGGQARYRREGDFLFERFAKLIAAVPYRHIPLVLDGKVAGILSRSAVLNGQGLDVHCEPAVCVAPSVTIREAVQRMVNESQELVLLTSNPDGKLLGLVTLHDVLRFQNQFTEML